MSPLDFEQMLLLISYLLVTSNSPYRDGDRVQLDRILGRTKTEWKQKIETECYNGVLWGETHRGNYKTGDILCMLVTSHFPVTATVDEVQDQVRWLLERIKSHNPPSPEEKVQKYPCGFDIILLCASFSVEPTKPKFPEGSWRLSDEYLRTMSEDLNKSKLFQNDPIDIPRLEAALRFARSLLSNTPILLPSELDPESLVVL